MKLRTSLLWIIIFSFSLVFSTAQATQVSIKNLLAIEISDWNGDASKDKAVLALPENKADEGVVLYIYLSDDKQGTLIEKKNIAWAGSMWGTSPTLSVNKSGSLIVQSMNEAIGRNRWHRDLILSYRNNKFIVSGYRYTSHDTLKVDSQFYCDVNFLTGKGIVNGKAFRVDKKKRLLKDWSEDKIPKECN